jgi:AcrR family transcriptional regulator
MASRRTDPRPARSRARLLDAATALLRTGGPNAVTVDAVTRGANVARATLYRHFPSGNDLLAAAFHSLIPPAPMPPESGTLRERLLALMHAQSDLISETPALLTATYWLALGPDMEHMPEKGGGSDSPEVRTLRERVAQQYGAPFDAIFDSPDAREELGEVDRAQAMMLLIGPLVAGRISTLTDFDYRECARAAVDGFLAVHRIREITSASSESAGV